MTNPNHELVIIRNIIPWHKIIDRLTSFYDDSKGAYGKSLRWMIAILIVMRYRGLSDREVIRQIKENRYIQYFCNIPDEVLQTFIHHTSIYVFRKRIGKQGVEMIENEVFEVLRRAGVIKGDNALIDSSVLPNDIIYPNDVLLLYRAFKKMKEFAKLHKISLWWDDKEIKRLWKEYNLQKRSNRLEWLIIFNLLFVPALEQFKEMVNNLETRPKREEKAKVLLNLLELLETQTLEKINGETHIDNRIVSLDEPDARPIKKGKEHPKCEFGSTIQMSFNREGFMITIENFIGNPNDKKLFPETLALFTKRMKEEPETVTTDLGFRSQDNFKVSKNIKNVFLGRTDDVSEDKKDFCCKARSATEGFIAVAKNLRGFGRSLYKGFEGDRIWSVLCQTSYNLKKFILLLQKEKIEEHSLVKLGLA
ncbi:transposase [Desulfamplus magnetovallimortis]